MQRRYKKIQCLKKTDHLEIWKMMDEVSLQPVLAKSLLLSAPPALCHQFRMEQQVLSCLNTPWIPRLLDLEQNGQTMILYESWMEGERLDHWLEQNPSRSFRKKVFTQIVELIGLVHEAGYLYLDLKPDNVLIQNGHACLIDFNACVLMGSQRAVLSNPDALPPEHARGLLDGRADQIGLGRLHQRLFGFSLTGWKCLQKDPKNRFPSLKSLQRFEALTSCRTGMIGILLLCLMAFPLMKLFDSRQDFSTPASLFKVLKQDDVQKAQGLLYGALEQQSLDLQALNEDQISQICKTAFESGNSVLCRLILEGLDLDCWQNHPLEQMRLQIMAGVVLEEEQLSQLYLEISCSDQAASDLALLAMALAGQAHVMPETCVRLLHCAQSPKSWDEQEALLFMQSLMSLSGQRAELPKPLCDSLEQCSEGRKMLEIWNALHTAGSQEKTI